MSKTIPSENEIERIEHMRAMTELAKERDTYRSLLYRLVVKKDGTARIEAEALLKGEGK